jgi:CheY-like chemotaxis protein
MKKILIAKDLHTLLQQKASLLNRSDIRIWTASTNDELLRIHSAEKVDLIITDLDLPGMSTEQMAATIRGSAELRMVQIIMACPNSRSAIEQCSRCKPNAVILRPINPGLLLARAQKILELGWRENIRVQVNVSWEGHADEITFFCRTQDLSTTGMLIETEKTLPGGTKLTCALSLPDSRQIRATAEVVRSVDRASGGLKQYGVQFVSISAEDGRTLEEFIDKNAGKLSSSRME